MMKYKLSFMLTLFLGILSTQASQTTPTPNPPVQTNQTATQNPLDLLSVGSAKGTIHGTANYAFTAMSENNWATLIQEGCFTDSLYMRMLLSEFYCARCAIGASPFTNSDLQQTITWPSDLTGGKDCGTMHPGGFDTSGTPVANTIISNAVSVDSFVKTAKTYAGALQTARLQFEQGGFYGKTVAGLAINSGITMPPNPLDSFAGTIIIPTKEFLTNLGTININGDDNFISGPTLIPYKNTTKDSTSANVSISGSFYLNKITTESVSLVDLTLSTWPSTTLHNGQPISFRFKSITGNISGQPINMDIYNPQASNSPQGTNAADMQKFINADLNNPWALVVQLNAKKNAPGKSPAYVTNATIPALVRLNPIDFPPKTVTNLNTLLEYPSQLYYSVTNVVPGQITSTARLLRGIANGYLTSWSYNALYPSQLLNKGETEPSPAMQPYNSTNAQPQSIYPTPTKNQFYDNNNDIMFYALYGCRKALELSYITQHVFPSLPQIIANPFTTSVEGYIGQQGGGSTAAYYPVCQLFNTTTISHSLQQPKVSFLKRTITYLSNPFRKIKNIFSKHITL